MFLCKNHKGSHKGLSSYPYFSLRSDGYRGILIQVLHIIIVNDTKGVSLPRGQCHCTRSQNLPPVHIYLLRCLFWMISHTIIDNDQRECHYLDTGSFLQVQGHSPHYSENWCVGHNVSIINRIWMILHSIVIRDHRMCQNFVSMSNLEGQGKSAHIAKSYVNTITFYGYLGLRCIATASTIIIEKTLCIMRCPSTDLFKFFQKYCTLTNKALRELMTDLIQTSPGATSSLFSSL